MLRVLPLMKSQGEQLFRCIVRYCALREWRAGCHRFVPVDGHRLVGLADRRLEDREWSFRRVDMPGDVLRKTPNNQHMLSPGRYAPNQAPYFSICLRG